MTGAQGSGDSVVAGPSEQMHSVVAVAQGWVAWL